MTTTTPHTTTTIIPRPLSWRLTASTLLATATGATTIPVWYVATHLHPAAAAAMIPAGATLFVALVWRSNPSQAGR